MKLYMDNPEQKYQGRIKCYLNLREYGFITREKGKDVFFIRSDFLDEFHIIEGGIVEFEIEKTPKGPKAKNIKRIA